MPGIDRTTILTGPAVVTFAGSSFWSKGDITVTIKNKRFPIETAAYGKVDERISDRMVEVSFEPDGRFTSALAAVLWPYAATAIGASIYGSTDRPLVIWTRDGQKLTLPNAALTSMPNIRTGVSKTIQGSVTFTGLLAKSVDPATAGAYYTVSTATYAGDTGFAASDILTKPYASAWGTTPWDAFFTEDGWDISFGLQLAPQVVDNYGTVDMRVQSLSVTAKAIPIGPTETQILALLQPNSVLGSSIATTNPLNISATGIYVRLYNAGLADAQLGYGANKKRIGTCEWIATRTVTTGTLDPLFYVGTSAPA